MLIFPLIPVGLSTEHVNFCGSVTLKPDTFYHVLYDICKGLAHHGFRSIADLQDASGCAVGKRFAGIPQPSKQCQTFHLQRAIKFMQPCSRAVVAQEVRSLAEQSKESTEQIRRILNDIQKAISSAVMATEQGGKTVEVSVLQSAETDNAIQVIGQGAGGTVQAAAQILASTNEQVAGINQVAIAMDNIRSASDQIVISMRQAEDATSSLNQMSSKLWSLIERFKVS
jgi:dGTP triphosphohydrolase